MSFVLALVSKTFRAASTQRWRPTLAEYVVLIVRLRCAAGSFRSNYEARLPTLPVVIATSTDGNITDGYRRPAGDIGEIIVASRAAARRDRLVPGCIDQRERTPACSATVGSFSHPRAPKHRSIVMTWEPPPTSIRRAPIEHRM